MIQSDVFKAAQAVARFAMRDMRDNMPHVFSIVYFESNAEKVPSTGKAIHKAFQSAMNGVKKMPILATPKDCACFLGEHGNNIYRAIHDYDHFIFFENDCGGTTKLHDEIILNQKMVKFIMAYAEEYIGVSDSESESVTLALESCLYADLVGQAFYYANKKDFITNEGQLAFVKWLASAIIAGKNEGKNAIQVMEGVKDWPKF